MQIGDLVQNFHAVGIGDSWRPPGRIGVVVNMGTSTLSLSFGLVERTELLVVWQKDGAAATYSSISFRVIDV